MVSPPDAVGEFQVPTSQSLGEQPREDRWSVILVSQSSVSMRHWVEGPTRPTPGSPVGWLADKFLKFLFVIGTFFFFDPKAETYSVVG